MVPAHDPLSFTAQMARMNARLMIHEAKRHGVDLEISRRAAAKLCGAEIARGEGGRDRMAAFLDPLKRAKARAG